MQQRTPHRFVGLAAALALTLLASAAAARGNGNAPPPRVALGASAEGEVIVRFRADAPTLRRHVLAAGARGAALQSALDGRAAALGARHGRSLVAAGAVSERTQVVRAAGVNAATLARQLAADPEVEWAEPNGIKRRLTAPNDPLYPALALGVRPTGPDVGQWYLRAPDSTLRSAINIEAAWTRLGNRGSNSVVVAVLDTGVRFEHPDLGRFPTGRLLDGYDFVANNTVSGDGQDGRDGDPSDPGDFVTSGEAGRSPFTNCSAESSSWHGTATASLVGALTDNGIGMAGAAPGTRVLPVRVLGKCFGVDSDIQAAMRWAAGISVPGVPDNPNPAKVLNLSLGGSGACSASYQAVVDEIVARGVTIVAAAGNTAGQAVNSPANCNGVIAVLALRHAGTKVGFSDLGPEITIAAPGGNCINIRAGTPCLYPILSATNLGTTVPLGSSYTDSFDVTVGTSFSSPLVAATAALMYSAQPMLGVSQLRNALRSTARAFPSSGADNGPDDPTPVTQCQAPQAGVDQLQCYCTTALCGAGMMDAGAAVAAVAGSAGAVVTSSPASPIAGNAITFASTGSFAQSGATISSYSWTLLDGGGIASGFTSATNAATASLTPNGAGTLRVRLTVTDSLGASASADLAVTVAAAPTQPPSQPPPPAPSGGGGAWLGLGGAGWLLGLGSLVLALARSRRR